MGLTAGCKVALLCVLFSAAVRRAEGQGNIATFRPCGVDNLSCPNTDPTILECYTRNELCNDFDDCDGGSDEGRDLVSLDCDGIFSGQIGFACDFANVIDFATLCDGNSDCPNGDDETTTLCENKCLTPYYGDCPYTRVCITSEFDVNCGACLTGFINNFNAPTGPCLLEIGLERIFYVGSESAQITEQICAVLYIDTSLFVGGLAGVVNAIRNDYFMGDTTVPIVVGGQIQSLTSTAPNAASTNDFQVASLPVQLDLTSSPPVLSGCVSFVVTDDSVFDPGEVFNVQLTTSTPYAIVRPTNSLAEVFIEDDDLEVLAVYLPTSYSVNEDDGIAEVCIALISPSPAGVILQVPSTVTPTFIGGSASSASDYFQVATPASVQFNAGLFVSGSTPTGRECFTFPLINDQIVEGLETVLLGLGATTGLIEVDNTRADSQAIVNIFDDDEALFSLDMAGYSISETGGAQRVFAQIVNGVTLSTNVEVTVRTLPANPLSAMVPGDYLSRSMTFTFQPGNQGARFLDIPIVDDDIPESVETFQVELFIEPAFTNFASRVNPFLSPVTIIDGDNIPFTLSLGSGQVAEAGGNAVATVTPMGLIPSQIVLLVSTMGGTALANEDFTSLTNILLTFNPGSGSRSVNIPINNDILVEGNENFIVFLSSNDPRADISGSPASVTIIDDDVIRFGFTDQTYSQDEDGGQMIVSLELRSDSGIPLTQFTALVSTSNSNAIAGSDYVALMNLPVLFPAFSQPGTTRNFQVSMINDEVPETTESFQLSTSSNDLNAVAVVPTATGLIFDDDRPAVGFQRTLYSVDEEMVPGIVAVCVQIFSQGSLLQSVDVNFNTEDGSATSGSDYFAILGRVLTFPAGSPTGSSICVDISIINDNELELFGENFFANIDSADATTAPDRAQINLGESNDEIECNFEQASQSVVEGNIAVETCIVCNGNSLAQDIVLNVQSTPLGSATANVDFMPVSEPLTFTSVIRRRCVDVGIIDDPIVEFSETIPLIATGVSLPPRVTIGTGSSTITIIDNDFLPISLVPEPPVPENVGFVEICVETTGQLAPGVTAALTVGTFDGRAVAPGDFSSTTVERTFTSANDDGPLCFNVLIQDDDICEDDEFFIARVISADTNVQIVRQSINVQILDNDVARIALTNVDPNMPVDGGYQVTECVDDSLYFDIAIINGVSKGPNVQCQITVRTEDGTALADSDYTALNRVCTLTSTNSMCDFHLEIIDDFTAELDESFNVILESSDPRCAIVDNNITFYIIDDEDCDDGVCDDFDICKELMCPNNFTCMQTGPDIGDDPHFAVTLASGRTLCYTVQGEHGFAFNLISNKKLYMNAMFVPDAHREEVTWLGTMGIVVNNNGYKKSNMTRLRFEAIKNKIHIDDQMVLEARNIEKITIENGKLTISEAPPVEGYKQPFVRVDLRDVELSFSVKFMTEHLDLYWHTTGQNVGDSHGLIGQFFHRDVVLDDVRKILMIPGKEPVPVQRKPVWAFMEREAGDSSNFCWVAMNPGYQGEGLIDGTYFDYLVDDVLSTEFKFKKL